MKTLPKAIRAQVNQMAHRQASRYALQVRDMALRELQQQAQEGLTVAELLAALERIEVTTTLP